ncbi:MAG: NAD-dependent epimerase/dehydratase family protein [Rhodospirillaceae bacterium]
MEPPTVINGAAVKVVAVTGATGFVGGHILRHLTGAGLQVRALTRKPPRATAGVTWVTGALEDEAALGALLDRADAVIHCAGAIKARSRDEFFDVNAGGTRRLAGLAGAKAKPPRFIHLSSLAAREPALSSYAASKRAAEQVLKAFTRLPVMILRPPAVYGPGDMETFRIFKFAEQGWFVAPMTGGKLSLIHVDDVARAVLGALQAAEWPANPVEFDDGRPGGYTWPEIAAAAGAAMGSTPRIIRLPAALLYMIGAAASAASQLTRRPSVLGLAKMREFLHPDWVAAGSPPAGFKPLWDIEKGFADAVKWYASRGLLKSNGEVDLSP